MKILCRRKISWSYAGTVLSYSYGKPTTRKAVVMFEWKESDVIAPRLWEYVEILSEDTGEEESYELTVYRMDDAHNTSFFSNAYGFKYHWSLSTTETFGISCDGTILTDGYTMTREEAEKEAIKAYNEREKWRKYWRV